MRWLRASLLGLTVLVLGRLLVGATDAPLADASQVVRGAHGDGPAGGGAGGSATAASDLAALLTGGCALVLLAAGTWLAAAVAVCTWEALHDGREHGHVPRRADDVSTVLRPRVVRGLVATVLGVTAVAVPPTAQARAERPGPAGNVAVAAVTGVELSTHPLRGLPVPDRPTGRLAVTEQDRGAGAPVRPAPRQLQVRPGDSLWRLAAGFLPAGASDQAVTVGWRLLYAANREVIGADPDLLRPGQTLRVPAVLTTSLPPKPGGPS